MSPLKLKRADCNSVYALTPTISNNEKKNHLRFFLVCFKPTQKFIFHRRSHSKIFILTVLCPIKICHPGKPSPPEWSPIVDPVPTATRSGHGTGAYPVRTLD